MLAGQEGVGHTCGDSETGEANNQRELRCVNAVVTHLLELQDQVVTSREEWQFDRQTAEVAIHSDDLVVCISGQHSQLQSKRCQVSGVMSIVNFDQKGREDATSS